MMGRAWTAGLALAAVVVWVGAPGEEAAAVGPADVIGIYDVRLSGDAFERDADSGRVAEERVRGRALCQISAAPGDPRLLTVEVRLAPALDGGLFDRTNPTPALRGTGVLVGDSLTVIGAGQANYVNALTLRFLRRGRKVSGSWIASFPGSDTRSGYVAGAGVSLRGKRRR